ncbi:unnamed protein product [Macrosiphum euphorbiae]|uniref:Uncharacterized protein n=1 Tax=Macrosiphum euphorbiae TaxID=13131 RepID=A0AAV0WU96_9HEMI|nr:unnamed protein product [Macrosiphum euphorbiae]
MKFIFILYILGKDKNAISIAKRNKVSGLVPFEKLYVQTRHFEMFIWFVDKNVASIAVSGNGLINSYFAIDDIKRHFDSDGRGAHQQVVEIKRINPTWICKSCNGNSSNNSIGCNRCLKWFQVCQC